MRPSILLIPLLAITTSVRAGDAPHLETKNKSSFKMESGSRDPFWPIGWKPVAKISHAEGDQAGPDIPPSAFSVTSITLGAAASEHFAIINGKIMQEGQTFGLQIGSQTYQISVKTIEDGRVILSRRDSEIAVPLRRK